MDRRGVSLVGITSIERSFLDTFDCGESSQITDRAALIDTGSEVIKVLDLVLVVT
jgi:hypothetical protein